MSMYRHIQKTFQQEYHERSDVYRARISKWRQAGAIERAERPTNLARARCLGYKAKQGYCIVRVRVGRGMRKRPHPWGGRKPGKNYAYVQPGKSLQHIAEERAARRYRNLEVLNSYFVGSDGQYKYFEVILVEEKAYPGRISRGRPFRGLTSSSRRGRGLYSKGIGSEKTR